MCVGKLKMTSKSDRFLMKIDVSTTVKWTNVQIKLKEYIMCVALQTVGKLNMTYFGRFFMKIEVSHYS